MPQPKPFDSRGLETFGVEKQTFSSILLYRKIHFVYILRFEKAKYI